MKLPFKRFLLLSVVASLLGGAALAAYEINNLRQAMTVAHKVADAVAAGLSDGGTPTNSTATVSISLCFGLIPLERVDNPEFVIAVGDFVLGTIITGCAIALVYILGSTVRRNIAVDTSAGESRNT